MPVRFRKVTLSEEGYESAGVFDVDGDGVPDIVCGGFWYKGPDFKQKFRVGEIRAEGEYYDDFSTIPMDVNGNGRPDFITGGWWGETLRWRENPGKPGAEWKEHVIAECGNVETTRAWDVDGDGELELVPNTPNGPLVVYKLKHDKQGRGTGEFERQEIFKGPQGHGLGFGDVTGNGREDFILANGWLEAPGNPFKSAWKWHPEFDLGSASIPVLVADINGDGVSELVVGQSHAYGLHWWSQEKKRGKRVWTSHAIDPDNSQYHDLHWVDIDGDGEPELVTGKRYRAHNGNDPGAADDVGIYYFKWHGDGFAKQVIDHGTGGSGGKGCGIHFCVTDLNNDGRPDIVAPGKDGLCVFFNLGV